MAPGAVFGVLLITAFLPSSSSIWSFCGQPKLECRECKCSTACNCDNHCTQTQIVKDCNIGTDTHNTWATHYTTQNHHTRMIMMVSFSLNLCFMLLIIFRKPILNCLARRKRRQQLKKQSATQAEQLQKTQDLALVLKQMLHDNTPPGQLSPTAPPSSSHDCPSSIHQPSLSELPTLSALMATITKP
jgi:hypothetical protein